MRALEIQEFANRNPDAYIQMPEMEHRVFGIAFARETIIERIERRLRQRMADGMTAEVQRLLDEGVPVQRMLKFGLEYKHVTLFLTGQCTERQMFDNLFTDIRRFAKRQMTWLRRMERTGVPSSRYSPLVGVSRQPSWFSRVDLPEPEVPMMVTNSPS